MKKIFLSATTLLLSVMLVGCMPNKDTKGDSDKPKVTEKKAPKKDKTKKETTKKKSNGAYDTAEIDKQEKMVKEATGAKVKSLYENTESKSVTIGKETKTIDGYRVLQIQDYTKDVSGYDIIFRKNPDKKGIVILAQYTFKNDEDRDIYDMPSLDLNYPGGSHIAGKKNRDFFGEKYPKAMENVIIRTDDYIIKKGETVTGYFAYTLDQDMYENAKKVGGLTLTFDAPQSEKGFETKNKIGAAEKVMLPLSEENAKEVAEKDSFLPDRMTVDNMGTKTMLLDKKAKDLNLSGNLNGVDLTIEEMQVVKFEPNEDSKPRFEDFKNGIAAVTIKVKAKNGSGQNLNYEFMRPSIKVDDSRSYSSAGMLEPNTPSSTTLFDKDAETERLYVYLFDLEEYEKLLKDKSFVFIAKRLSDEHFKPVGDEDAQVEFKLMN